MAQAEEFQLTHEGQPEHPPPSSMSLSLQGLSLVTRVREQKEASEVLSGRAAACGFVGQAVSGR